MQPLGEIPEEVVLGVRGDAVDHELLVGDADGELPGPFEQWSESLQHAAFGGREGWMSARVHRAPMQRDR